jgi:predicted dehydrogenase
MPHRLSRRRFLQTTATAALGAVPILRAAEKKPAANERLHLGAIGTINQARYNIDNLVAAGAEVVALCDVDENRSGKTREKFPHASFDTDWRRLIDRKGLDAILVATPDHHHALATLAALRAGLHVYCEKPLTHTVAEARLVAETAAKQKRVTQMGTQIHAGHNYRRVVELIQSGAIGTVREAHTWCDKSYGGKDRPAGEEPVPAGFHWDLWLGPAPVRPFYHGKNKAANGVYHPFNWRDFWDFGGGTLNDMACHHMDLPFWALKLRHPTRVAAEGPPVHADTACPWTIVRYEFPARGELPPVNLTWYHGGKRPLALSNPGMPKWGDGNLFVGDKGMLLAGYGDHKLLPEKEYAGFKAPEPFIKNSIGHHKEFVEACKNGGTTTCNFDYSGALTEAVLLGTVSYRCGRWLKWDAANLKTNVPEAERFIHKEYRKGWSV